MPEEAEGWYAHIAESIEELRDELRRMEAANATPEQFGLKVRSHPDSLIITARNKMGSGERLVVSVGLANHFIETATLRRDKGSISANRNAAIGLAREIVESGIASESHQGSFSGQLFSSVPASSVLDFLGEFQNHDGSFLTETDPVIRYIGDRAGSELSEWDVFFPSLKNRPERSLVNQSLGFEVVCQRRKPGRRSDQNTLLITDKQRVSSRGIESVGLTELQIVEAKKAFRERTDPPLKDEDLNYPDKIYRHVRERPLLVVHLLAIGEEGEDLSGNEPVVAWSISFPVTEMDEKKVEYVVNTTWFRERYLEEEDEDEAGGDDD